MNWPGRRMVRLVQCLPRFTAAAVMLLLAACADGGGSGTGIGFGASTITGNVAATVADASSIAAAPVCPNLNASAMVSVRGTSVAAPIESDCTFELLDVPAGDVTLDFEVENATTALTLKNVPARTRVVLRDVRLRLDEPEPETDVAGIQVAAAEPVAAVQVGIVADPPKGMAPLRVHFSPRAAVPEVVRVTWHFGDGSPAAHEVRPAHVYERPGLYVVELLIAAPDGVDKAVFTVVRVHKPELVDSRIAVALSATPASGAPPLEVEFEATVEGALGARTFSWDFGDGTILDRGRRVERHTYAVRKGEFLAVVTVRDETGREAGDSFPIVVQPNTVSLQPTAVVGSERTPVATTTPAVAASPPPGMGVSPTPASNTTDPTTAATPNQKPSAKATSAGPTATPNITKPPAPAATVADQPPVSTPVATPAGTATGPEAHDVATTPLPAAETTPQITSREPEVRTATAAMERPTPVPRTRGPAATRPGEPKPTLVPSTRVPGPQVRPEPPRGAVPPGEAAPAPRRDAAGPRAR